MAILSQNVVIGRSCQACFVCSIVCIDLQPRWNELRAAVPFLLVIVYCFVFLLDFISSLFSLILIIFTCFLLCFYRFWCSPITFMFLDISSRILLRFICLFSYHASYLFLHFHSTTSNSFHNGCPFRSKRHFIKPLYSVEQTTCFSSLSRHILSEWGKTICLLSCEAYSYILTQRWSDLTSQVSENKIK